MSGVGNGSSGADRLVFSRNPAGDPIAECELAAADPAMLAGLAREAAARGAVWLWVHCAADLSEAGFVARPGYRRFTAAAVPPGDPLLLLETAAVLDLLPRAFIGQWGHHQFDAAWASAAEARYVGLGQDGDWTGLCRFEPQRRHIDGPGFPAGPGSPEAVRLLVAGAGAHLGAGPVTVETWGEPADAYLDLGFGIAEECGGWEQPLTASAARQHRSTRDTTNPRPTPATCARRCRGRTASAGTVIMSRASAVTVKFVRFPAAASPGPDHRDGPLWLPGCRARPRFCGDCLGLAFVLGPGRGACGGGHGWWCDWCDRVRAGRVRPGGLAG